MENAVGKGAIPVWNVLVVDDEPDMHAVTQLALKRRSWRGRSFKLTSAMSAKDAREVLVAMDPGFFSVALVDVVMETDSAGLELCDYIRSNFPASLRIILRTGQPGQAPEESVLNNYDIDHYLAKPEATAESIHALTRSCLRGSLDVRLLLHLGAQLQATTSALENAATPDALTSILRKNIEFLEFKYSALIEFFPDITSDAGRITPRDSTGKIGGALANAPDASNRESGRLHPGAVFGLEETMFAATDVLKDVAPPEPTGIWATMKGLFAAENAALLPLHYGYSVTFVDKPFTPRLLQQLEGDLGLFIANWRTARRVVQSQEQVASQRALRMLSASRAR